MIETLVEACYNGCNVVEKEKPPAYAGGSIFWRVFRGDGGGFLQRRISTIINRTSRRRIADADSTPAHARISVIVTLPGFLAPC
jgi:hypothetical protein